MVSVIALPISVLKLSMVPLLLLCLSKHEFVSQLT